MSGSISKTILVGRIGRDPEIKTFQDGNKEVRFALATSEYFIDRNGDKKEDTQWHNIVIKGKRAEQAEIYLQKGLEIGLDDAKIKYKSWDDESGVKKYMTEIVSYTFVILSKKKVTH